MLTAKREAERPDMGADPQRVTDALSDLPCSGDVECTGVTLHPGARREVWTALPRARLKPSYRSHGSSSDPVREQTEALRELRRQAGLAKGGFEELSQMEGADAR